MKKPSQEPLSSERQNDYIAVRFSHLGAKFCPEATKCAISARFKAKSTRALPNPAPATATLSTTYSTIASEINAMITRSAPPSMKPKG